MNVNTDSLSERIAQSSARSMIELNLQSQVVQWNILRSSRHEESEYQRLQETVKRARIQLMETGVTKDDSLALIDSALRSLLDESTSNRLIQSVTEQEIPAQIWKERFEGVIRKQAARISAGFEGDVNEWSDELNDLSEYIASRAEKLEDAGINGQVALRDLKRVAVEELPKSCIRALNRGMERIPWLSANQPQNGMPA